MSQETTLISIVGPTAIGKTALSIAIANHLNCPILSADSRQFYKEMTIGTAVPVAEEIQAAEHYFIQHRSIHQPYSVGAYEREGLALIEQLRPEHRYLILVGGSGLYTKAVISGLDEFPEVPQSIRSALNTVFETDGIQTLQEELKTVDPDYYAIVDVHNHQRVIRGLEIYRATGRPFSSFRTNSTKKRPFNILSIGLKASREEIYQRIDLRVDQMINQGLLEEVKALFEYRDLNALQTVGYRELFAYLDHQIDFETAVALIKTNTRRFSKRQMTWFQKDATTLWFDYHTKPEDVIKAIRRS